MEPGERIIRMYADICDGGAEAIAAHLSEGCVMYDTNVPPVRGRDLVSTEIVKVREHWRARWTIDSLVAQGDHVATEWTMTGQLRGEAFTFHGSDHYWVDGDENRVREMHQYWTFRPDELDTGLVGFEPHATGSAR